MIKPILAILVLLVASLPVMALAQAPPPPPSSIPHAFYGTVEFAGGPAPSGTSITAQIDGEERGSVTTNRSGEYGTQGPFDTTRLLVNGNASDEGKTVDFFVNGHKAAESGEWHSGSVTNLNLTVPPFCGDGACNGGETCSSCPQDCGSCPRRGGGGAAPPACTPLWECTDWSECVVDGTQTRECSDANSCGTDLNRPAESKACEAPDDGLPRVCVAGLRVCAGQRLMECTGDAWKEVMVCPERCFQGECLGYGEDVSGEDGGPPTGFFLDPATSIYAAVMVAMAAFGAGLAWWWKRRSPASARSWVPKPSV